MYGDHHACKQKFCMVVKLRVSSSLTNMQNLIVSVNYNSIYFSCQKLTSTLPSVQSFHTLCASIAEMIIYT